jgi:hypothetical protein
VDVTVTTVASPAGRPVGLPDSELGAAGQISYVDRPADPTTTVVVVGSTPQL